MKFTHAVYREDDMVEITTDSTDLPVVTYPIDKFKSVEDLEREVMRKIAEVTRKKVKKQNDVFKTALDERVQKDKKPRDNNVVVPIPQV